MPSSHSISAKLRSSVDLETTGRYLIAYSGGVDSLVLLHAMADLFSNHNLLLAVHVDHRLHEASKRWARHCLTTAAALRVDATLLTIDEVRPDGESVEAWARRHRYRLLKSLMGPEDVLLTAHHLDDLAETLLLQLFRGAGPHGLASIPERQPFGPGTLVRPLLKVTHAEIRDYAGMHALEWIDDPTNLEDKYDRNFIRHQVLPVIEQRWPAASARIAHVVDLQQQAAACLDLAADTILEPALSGDSGRLALATLQGLKDDMQRWVLRRWIVRAGFPIPDSVHLQEMQRLLSAREDAEPCVSWKGAELRRYRDMLFLRRPSVTTDCQGEYSWDLHTPLSLPAGEFSAVHSVGSGLNATLAAQSGVLVRFRRGGERCHPFGRNHSQSLKRLFQEWGVPPWQRFEVPLVFLGGELAAVADFCICREFAAAAGDAGWTLQWRANPVPNSG